MPHTTLTLFPPSKVSGAAMAKVYPLTSLYEDSTAAAPCYYPSFFEPWMAVGEPAPLRCRCGTCEEPFDSIGEYCKHICEGEES